MREHAASRGWNLASRLFRLIALGIILQGVAASAWAACAGPQNANWKPLYDANRKSIAMGYRLIKRGQVRILEARGTIKGGETQRLQQALNRHSPIHEVWLYSGGGASAEGMDMGRLLRKRGMAVRVPKGAVCFSACSMVFLGGALRAVDPGAYYGVHMWTRWRKSNAEKIVDSVVELTKKAPKKEVVRQVVNLLQSIERRNADYARERANYLIQMSVSLRLMVPNVQTKASNEYWLCPNEMRSFNVINF
jgi:hypothetical protein